MWSKLDLERSGKLGGVHLKLLGQAVGLSIKTVCDRPSAVSALVGWRGGMLCQVSGHVDRSIIKNARLKGKYKSYL